MLGFGYWTKSEMTWPDGVGWLDLGAGVADLGPVRAARRRRPQLRLDAQARARLAGDRARDRHAVYVVALAVAWWAMSAKVPS